MSATEQALALINKKISGSTKAKKSEHLRAGLEKLINTNLRAVLNFGAGYRELNKELMTLNGLDAALAQSAKDDYFTLFTETKARTTRARGSRPQATSWPFADSLAGVVVLLGNKGGGKTTHMVSVMEVDIIIRTSEPTEIADGDERILHAWDAEEAFSLAILCALAGLKCGVDGMRELVFNSVGNSTTGGIDSNVYTFLTAINNIVAGAGTSIVATLNPMTERQFGEVAGSVESSVSGVLTFRDGQLIGQTYRGANGRIFSSGVVESGSPDEPAEGIATSVLGSVELSEKTASTGLLPYGAADFDEEDNPPARVGSRVTVSQ